MLLRKIIKRCFLRLKNRTCIIASYQISADVKLEERVRLYESVYVGHKCKIGKYSYVNPYTFIDDDVEIGRYCSISRNVLIGLGAHRLDGITTHPIGYSKAWNPYIIKESDNHKKTIIGNDVWIGAGAIILGGVTIGNGAVIGAGAIVTKSVSDYAIVAGTPARVIKQRKVPQKIKGVDWWDLPSEEALEAVVENNYSHLYEHEYENNK